MFNAEHFHLKSINLYEGLLYGKNNSLVEVTFTFLIWDTVDNRFQYLALMLMIAIKAYWWVSRYFLFSQTIQNQPSSFVLTHGDFHKC